ncbi:MAG TPA: tRNA (N6-threonylcarbamoyladenosine(37)-N6)-methyltransferase TrmO [Rhabdaerophilum sp.]|nr:tRNA (N6-threonylcarbamoyladenosine(37)-N6)-methyltransferase TrmO [Rhabdaerophilum sp.]
MDWDATRPGEIETPLPEKTDAGVYFIGRIRTPYPTRNECPRQGMGEGPICRVEIDARWRPALRGLENYRRVELLYWMHQARRDLLLQSPHSDKGARGTFALRSPVRPNPIATSLVDLVAVEPDALLVRSLDCVDGTPLIDIKPDRCSYSPPSPSRD